MHSHLQEIQICYFLDEPTVGMDITSRRTFWETIRKLASEGKTIILTTHYLEEADALANRILLFANGKVIADGTPDEMKATISRKTITFYSKESIPAKLLKRITKRNRSTIKRRTLHFNNRRYRCNVKSNL